MKVEIIELTPGRAKVYLSNNKNNRNVSLDQVNFNAGQMKRGEWLENGEAIIIDRNGEIKDGQHRLLAVVKANYSYKVPVVTGVDPEVMSTIDTGVNRKLSDVLKLEGFKFSTQLAGVIKAINSFSLNKKHHALEGINRGYSRLSNKGGLTYAKKNREYLIELNKHATILYAKQPIIFIPPSKTALLMHILAPNDPENPSVTNFMKELLGITTQERNGVAYVRKLGQKAKQNKTPINKLYLLALIIKAWNLYLNGDPAVNHIKHDLKTPFPKITKAPESQ